ncbi:ATP-dependent Clp protease adapter ClpS [Falsarthrobacter nasiphocae]|uniref:ATP-dependent Clp protease adapter protein ClpS n=1 Tax=Falsarthrobacter nasiphocae TaxID=189863 RepID=A0AAE4C7R6_9MICC|nr:ATP-dependent Clp protease adapter ClpS [Falsarthrobacter nasiphocae]MDR6892794.1 ATP-dependent Clp protease adaptor protein ClpS [Falsarthrobacter nasiphocae]
MSHPLSEPAGGVSTLPREDEALSTASPWRVVVWNDPVNLMDYVAYVFRSYFGMSAVEADRLMLAVHEEGRAVVATGGREACERDAQAMHRYGLHATIEQDSRG